MILLCFMSFLFVVNYTADKVHRIQELEDEIQELGMSLGELSHQLAVARNEANSNLHSLNTKTKELEDAKDSAQVEVQIAQHRHNQVVFCECD